PDLSGRENIYVNGTILGMRIAEIRQKVESIIAFSEIEEFINMPVKKYSSGMYLRLAFSIAIHSEPDIYLIDEILTVDDESFQMKCIEKIRDLQKKQKSLIIISHDKSLVRELAQRIIYLENGSIVDTQDIGSCS